MPYEKQVTISLDLDDIPDDMYRDLVEDVVQESSFSFTCSGIFIFNTWLPNQYHIASFEKLEEVTIDNCGDSPEELILLAARLENMAKVFREKAKE